MTHDARLGDVTTINPSFVANGTPTDERVAFLPMAAVNEDSTYAAARQSRAFHEVRAGYCYFQDGDVLVAKITPCFENGKITQARINERHGFGSTEFHVLRSHSDVLNARYLVQFLRQDSIRIDGARKMTGSAGQRRVPRYFLEDLIIPLPPLPEQRRIAAILDQAEALRAKRRQSLARLDALTQSIFVEMFGDPSSDSLSEPLGDKLSFLTSGGRGWAKYYAARGSRFIRSLDVQMNCIGTDAAVYVKAPSNAEARRTRVRSGDVLLTITGSRIGRVAPVSSDVEGAYISQHVAILRTDPARLDPHFLSFFLSMANGGQRQISQTQYGQTKPGLGFAQIERFMVPAPTLELQREFGERAKLVGDQRRLLQASLTQLERLFASIQHRAFRGEL